MRKRLSILVFITIVIFNICPSAGAQTSRQVVQSTLLERAAAGESELRVIVVLDQAKALALSAASSDPTARQSLRSQVAASQEAVMAQVSPAEMKVNGRLENLPIFAATVSAKGISALAQVEGVALVQEDRPIFPAPGPGLDKIASTAGPCPTPGPGPTSIPGATCPSPLWAPALTTPTR